MLLGMAMPKTKGPTIQFRLPLELHALLERAAAKKKQTPSQFAYEYLVTALRKATTKDPQ